MAESAQTVEALSAQLKSVLDGSSTEVRTATPQLALRCSRALRRGGVAHSFMLHARPPAFGTAGTTGT